MLQRNEKKIQIISYISKSKTMLNCRICSEVIPCHGCWSYCGVGGSSCCGGGCSGYCGGVCSENCGGD